MGASVKHSLQDLAFRVPCVSSQGKILNVRRGDCIALLYGRSHVLLIYFQCCSRDKKYYRKSLLTRNCEIAPGVGKVLKMRSPDIVLRFLDKNKQKGVKHEEGRRLNQNFFGDR